MEKMIVKTSPHFSSKQTTRSIMLDVVIALVPAFLFGIYNFGIASLIQVALSIGSCVLGEFLFNKIAKKENTLKDLSAIVSGLILGLNLPCTAPFYVSIVGGIFAMMLIKCLFGGLGKNFVNPAIAARVFLLITWASAMTTFVKPIYGLDQLFKYVPNIFNSSISVRTGATALAIETSKVGGRALAYRMNKADLLDLFIGRVGGTVGETSAVAILAGGIYLMVRKVINPVIPLSVLGSAALFTLIVTGDAATILPSLCSGGLMFGAIFMATDYATSPNSLVGQIIFGVCIGLITILIRAFATLPEGVSYAILLMNLFVPIIDKYVVRKPFGYEKPQKGGNK